MSAGNRLVCPHCLSGAHLFENAAGWRETGEVRMVAGQIKTEYRHNRVEDAERTSWGCSSPGCNVDRELRDGQLVQIDRDGKRVPKPPAEQKRFSV